MSLANFHPLAVKFSPRALVLTLLIGACSSSEESPSEPSGGTSSTPSSTGSSGSSSAGRASAGGNAGGASLGGAASSTGGVGEVAGVAGMPASAGAISMGGGGSSASTAGSGGMAGGGVEMPGGGKAGSGGSGGVGSCMTPPALAPVMGWAAVAGMNQATTSGGGNATPQVVTTLAAFKAAVSGDAPAVIHLNAVLEPAAVAVGSNKTIVGVCGAEFHGHLGLTNSANVIVRNLKIVGYGVGDCSKDPGWDASVGCSSGEDAVTVKASHHVWFDHCDVSDGTDGNLDINGGADFITISWTKFHYTARTDNVGDDATGANGHRYSNLIGSGDNVPEDAGHLNVTFHHDWWADNVNQRMPRTRRGKIHIVNNLYTSVGNSYCTNSGFETHVLVENNLYIGVKNPLSPDADGDMLARGNVFTNVTGTSTASGTGFTPPYSLTPEGTGTLEAAIKSGVGPR